MAQQGVEFELSAVKMGCKYEPIWPKHLFFWKNSHPWTIRCCTYWIQTIRNCANVSKIKNCVCIMNVFKHLVVNLIMCTAFKLFYLSFEETAENPQFDKVNIYQIMGKKSRQERLYIFFCCLLTGGIWIAKNLCRL